MSCAEWRTQASVLEWCWATTLAMALPGCVSYVRGVDIPVVEGPVAVAPHQAIADPDSRECHRYCSSSYGSTGKCHYATLEVDSKNQARASAAPSSAIVVVCETDTSGEWQTHSFTPFMQFGRRPAEQIGTSLSAPLIHSAREHFEQAALQESLAIRAFQQLVFDLEALAAPAQLIHAAKRAVLDEARHARWTFALARH